MPESLMQDRPRTVRHGGMGGFGRVVVPVLVLFALTLSLPASAAKKSYRYEEDPIRLGKKAMTEGRLDDAKANFQEAVENEWEVDQARYGLAEIMRIEGKYTEAEALYRRAIDDKNKFANGAPYPEANAGLGVVLLRQGKTDDAKREFEAALSQKGGLWAANYGLARILIDQKRYDEAMEYLDKGKTRKGIADGEDEYRYGLALVQFAQNSLADAEKNALYALNMNPNEAEYGILVGQIYTARNAPTLAIDAIEKALATPGVVPTAPVHHSLGQLYEGQKQWTDALRHYREAIRVDSTFAPAFKSAAKLYALATQYDKAAQFYLKYTELKPDDPEGWFGQSEAFAKLGSNRRALDAAEKAYALDSTDVRVRLTLARASYQSNDIARSELLYSSVSDTAKYEAADWVKLGQIALAQRKLDLADTLLTRGLKMDTTSADAYAAKGKLYFSRQQPDSAAIFFEKALFINPNSAAVKINLGLAYFSLKRTADAIRTLREGVALSPDALPGHIYLGQVLASADSLSAGLAEYKRAMEIDPKNAAAMRGAGFIYLKKGDSAQAVSILTKATEVDPKNAEGWVWLGNAQSGLRQIDDAIVSFQKALEINPNHEGAKKALEALKKAKAAPGGK